MKNLLAAFFLIMALLPMSFAQQTEGYLKMEIVDVNVTSPEMAQMAGMMKGTTQEIFFTKEMQRMDMDMMSGMVKIKTFTNQKDGSMNMFYDMMGNKMQVQSTITEAESAGSEDIDYKVEVVESEKKQILGYDCKRVIVTLNTDQGDMKIKMFVTEDIKMPASMVQNVKSGVVPGVPLEIETDMGVMSLKMVAKDFKKEVDKSKFTMPEGYKKMTMKEFQEQMGGMGGMGF